MMSTLLIPALTKMNNYMSKYISLQFRLKSLRILCSFFARLLFKWSLNILLFRRWPGSIRSYYHSFLKLALNVVTPLRLYVIESLVYIVLTPVYCWRSYVINLYNGSLTSVGIFFLCVFNLWVATSH